MSSDDPKVPTQPVHHAWPRIPRLDAPAVEVQLEPDGCGAACAVMLLADRAQHVDQATVARDLMMPSLAEDIAACMTALSSSFWRGGALSEGMPVSWELIDFLCSSRGSWAALLQPRGPVSIGHWVVVDGITNDGLVLVRDPVGAAYGIPLADFAASWSYTVLVLQQETP